jgi:hypothetical protein
MKPGQDTCQDAPVCSLSDARELHEYNHSFFDRPSATVLARCCEDGNDRQKGFPETGLFCPPPETSRDLFFD